MKKQLFLLYILFFIVSCNKDNNQSSSSSPSTNPIVVSTEKYINSVDANNAFALDFHRQNVTDEADKNAFTSPYSIYMALSMLWNGADGNSSSELQTTLRTQNTVSQNNESCFQSLQLIPSLDPLVTMEVANSVWVKNRFDVIPNYTDILKSKFGAVAKNVPFDASTVNEVNQWCGDKTHQKITKIVEKFSGDEALMLINAVYFNAPWKMSFDKALTKKEGFKLLNGSTKQVDMMNGANIPVSFKSETDYQVATLGYGKQGKFSLTIIMPNDISKFYEFEKTLDFAKFKSINENKLHALGVIKFPKIQIDYEKSLVSHLKTLGMKDLFDESKANLAKINAKEKIFVSDVFHKTYLKINEEGTEAAAITSVIAINTSQPITIDLTFDKPFLIVIQENETGRILFIGRITNP